jgi:hypothetical protein
VFDLDLQHCANCGGGLKITAAILEQPVGSSGILRVVLAPQSVRVWRVQR